MHRVVKISVSKYRYPEIWEYADGIAHLAKNLHNAALFRMRQNYTALDYDTHTRNQRMVYEEMMLVMERYLKHHAGSVMSYAFLDRLMRVTCNPDYFAEGLPRQTANQILKTVCEEFRSFTALKDKHRKNEDGARRPHMPSYIRGEVCTFRLTNQDAVIYGRELKMPLTRLRLTLPEMPDGAVLKEVRVKPYMGRYIFLVTVDAPSAERNEAGPNMCGIDLGVDNIAAIVCNDGSSKIYKGGAVLSEGRRYAREKARAVGMITKEHENIHADSRHLRKIAYRHESFVTDQMHKISRDIVEFAAEHGAGTIVIGVNREMKSGSHLGKANNQNLHAIPHYRLRQMIEYKAAEMGIAVIIQEESYTSKADFTAGDFIPVYGKEKGTPSFSGRRRGRGLYVCHDGRVINADLNGAANILRKAVPDAFMGISDCGFLADPEVCRFM